jgi:SAM-dependent methyltransferase
VTVEDAYRATAPVYDTLTRHHDYPLWTSILERLAREQGLEGERVLDVACGTGKSFVPFLARGYDVVACDISDAMLERAREKAGPGVPLHRRDMRRLGRLGSFDFVTCLCDAVNHLTDPEELGRLFAGIAENLAPRGVFLFDVNAVSCYRTFWATDSLATDDGLALVWRGRAPADFAPGGLARAELLVLTTRDDGFWDEVAIEHVERHHPEALIRAAASEAGLEIASLHGLLGDGSPEPGLDELRHNKAVYVARHRG